MLPERTWVMRASLWCHACISLMSELISRWTGYPVPPAARPVKRGLKKPDILFWRPVLDPMRNIGSPYARLDGPWAEPAVGGGLHLWCQRSDCIFTQFISVYIYTMAVSMNKIVYTLLTPFFDTCQERRFYEWEVADLKETKRCTGSESGDGAKPMDQKKYFMKMLIRRVW